MTYPPQSGQFPQGGRGQGVPATGERYQATQIGPSPVAPGAAGPQGPAPQNLAPQNPAPQNPAPQNPQPAQDPVTQWTAVPQQPYAPQGGPGPMPTGRPGPQLSGNQFGAPGTNQFGSGQFGPGQFAGNQYGPGQPQFAPGQPAPQAGGSKGKVIAAVIIVVVIVAALVLGLLIWQPWKANNAAQAETKTFTVSHGVTVEVRIPHGWKGVVSNSSKSTMLLVVPNGEDRTSDDDLNDAAKGMENDPDAKPIHAVAAIADTCASSLSSLGVGEWKPDSLETDVDDGVAAKRYRATQRVDSTLCLEVVGVDMQPGSTVDDQYASDLAKKLVDRKQISGSKTI
ncbi:MAG: hypothetical protein QM658_10175 [Gordonia sp. (in: high G+C Gram-positive bacteria)]